MAGEELYIVNTYWMICKSKAELFQNNSIEVLKLDKSVPKGYLHNVTITFPFNRSPQNADHADCRLQTADRADCADRADRAD